jgi:hypothetical protein
MLYVHDPLAIASVGISHVFMPEKTQLLVACFAVVCVWYLDAFGETLSY